MAEAYAVLLILKEYKKPIICFATVIILVVLIIFIRRRLTKGNTTATARREERQLNQLIEASVDRGAAAPRLTDAQIDTIATNIYEACKGFGTNDSLLIQSIESIPTAADYLKVKAAFRRLDAEKNWWYTDGDMAVTIRDDVNVDSDTDMRIMRHLAKIGVETL